MSTDEDQFVALGLGSELFAVPVSMVLEILDMRPMYRVPDAPSYVAGIINVRGRSVPVIDLRAKLGLPLAEVTLTSRILVMEVPLPGRTLVLGLIADRVTEVATFNRRDIEPPPDIGVRWRSDYIRGVTRRDEHLVVIFNLSRLFASEDSPLLVVDGQDEPPPIAAETYLPEASLPLLTAG